MIAVLTKKENESHLLLVLLLPIFTSPLSLFLLYLSSLLSLLLPTMTLSDTKSNTKVLVMLHV